MFIVFFLLYECLPSFFGYMNVYHILSVYCYMNVYHIFRLYECLSYYFVIWMFVCLLLYECLSYFSVIWMIILFLLYECLSYFSVIWIIILFLLYECLSYSSAIWMFICLLLYECLSYSSVIWIIILFLLYECLSYFHLLSAPRRGLLPVSSCAAPTTITVTRWSVPYMTHCVLYVVYSSRKLSYLEEALWRLHCQFTWKITPHPWLVCYLSFVWCYKVYKDFNINIFIFKINTVKSR